MTLDTSSPSPDNADTPAAPPLRVMCVDDNRDAADTTAALLSVCGAETIALYGGEEALAALESFQPDVCILDISMPGMTGHELAARIRAATDDPPLLVTLTALDDYGTLKQAAESGFDLHFTKPVQPQELLQALNDYITSGKPA